MDHQNRDKQKEIEELEHLLRCRKIDNEKQGFDLYRLLHQAESEEESIANFLVGYNYRRIPDNIGEFSDGYHTFNELYHHRAVLFSVICNMMPDKAWKSKLHDTGDMYDGMFIVGIETEQGQATYHYDIEPYWGMFKVKELEKAPKWDGHTPSDAIQRIGNISTGYRKASDVAREIFEDVESLIDLVCHMTGLNIRVFGKYAELKKKYET